MKIAACFCGQETDRMDAVRKMLTAQVSCQGQDVRAFALSSHGAAGCIHTSDRHSGVSSLQEGPNGNLLMVTGVPIDTAGDLTGRLEAVLQGDYSHAATSLSCLDGGFAALFWDGLNGKLVVVGDCLGMQPLYLARADRRLLLATELKAFAASGLMAVEMDPAAWGAFVSLGFNVGNRTQLAGVERLGGATVLTYDPAKDSCESSVYWPWPEPRPDMTIEDVDSGALLDLMQREMEAYAVHSRQATLLLSGGFDSRLVSAMLGRIGFDGSALIVINPRELSGADAQFARRVAEQSNRGDYEVVEPSGRFFGSASYLKFLAMNEVTIPAHGLFIAQVARFIHADMRAVWEGLGPGFAFAPPYPRPGGFAAYTEDRCKRRDSLHWQAVFSVFAGDMAGRMYDGFSELLDAEVGRLSDDAFGVARFQIANQMRLRMGASPYKAFIDRVMPFTPCLGKAFWSLAAAIPQHVTAGGKLYLRLLERHFPRSMTVPICSGGKFYSTRSFTPGLYARKVWGRASRRLAYYRGRLYRAPIVGRMFAPPPDTSDRGDEELVDVVVRAVDPGHRDLDADAVSGIQKAHAPHDWPTLLARRMLFYWQTWRWVMQGRLRVLNADEMLRQERRRVRRA